MDKVRQQQQQQQLREMMNQAAEVGAQQSIVGTLLTALTGAILGAICMGKRPLRCLLSV